jgi:hypothetical protein
MFFLSEDRDMVVVVCLTRRGGFAGRRRKVLCCRLLRVEQPYEPPSPASARNQTGLLTDKEPGNPSQRRDAGRPTAAGTPAHTTWGRGLR